MSLRSARALAGVTLAIAAALALALIGGYSSSRQPARAGRAPTQSAREVRALSSGASPVIGRDIVSASGAPQRARVEAGAIDDEVSADGASKPDPCALLGSEQAGRILGASVSAQLALQGPTCIYRAPAVKRLVTLALLSQQWRSGSPVRQLRARMPARAGGRRAYCGVAGTPEMIVPLSGGRYLAVGAPCPIAAAFAAGALRTLASARSGSRQRPASRRR
ncbi:MAG TPA: hypothetical protein VKU89_04800 [Solirubrobacteraceae bacterium]|nr:hypothetical protein [Solirubrobacteraceae bacterium]